MDEMTKEFCSSLKYGADDWGEGSERVKGYDIPLSFEILSEIHDADQVGQD